MRQFSQGGVINTDDNLYLEFSAPFSIGRSSVMESNVLALIKHRGSILPYLAMPPNNRARVEQERRWTSHKEAVEATGEALAVFLGGRFRTSEFRKSMGQLEAKFPDFAPARFLKIEYMAMMGTDPRLLKKTTLILQNEKGTMVSMDISAVLVPVGRERASVILSTMKQE